MPGFSHPPSPFVPLGLRPTPPSPWPPKGTTPAHRRLVESYDRIRDPSRIGAGLITTTRHEAFRLSRKPATNTRSNSLILPPALPCCSQTPPDPTITVVAHANRPAAKPDHTDDIGGNHPPSQITLTTSMETTRQARSH
ncbi:hypothetical protein GCM10009556_007800 [Acrocarpospora pleiomorpha]